VSTPCGIVVIDKPAGPSSHEVVAWVRWALRLRTVGHCGTLDPPATGVLVVCVGEATKLAGFLVEDDKHYDARIVLGRATTTGDAHGETVATAAVPHDAIDRALAILPAWIGHHAWSPPSVSAVQQDGVRAHARVRAGEVFALPSRDMVVHALRITAVCREAAAIELALHVGKGTYVRTIATELGAALGVPAHLAALRRTGSGALGVADAITIDALQALSDGARTARLLPPDVLVGGWPAVSLEPDDAGRFLCGLRRRTGLADAATVRVYGSGAFLGSAHITAGELIPDRLLSPTEVEALAA
jgi:tRNA pseudouridine55 synthase